MLPQSQMEQKNPKWSTWDLRLLSDGSWHSWPHSYEHLHHPQRDSRKMQLEEGGKESSTTIFSSSMNLNLLKLIVKPHLCYATNKKPPKWTKQKGKTDLYAWFWLFKEDKQIQSFSWIRNTRWQRHIFECFQSRTSNNILHLPVVPTLTPDLQAVLITMEVYPLICVW